MSLQVGRCACTMRPCVEHACCLSSVCLLNGMDTCIAPTLMGPGYGTGWHHVVLLCNILVMEAEYITLYCLVDFVFRFTDS